MATQTLEEFLTKARPLNPDYTDAELTQAYQDRYAHAPVQTVSAAPLMTLDEFLPKARTLNPDYSDDELTAAWQEKYGARGAREKDQGDFVRGGVTAFKQIPQTIRGLEAGAGAIGEKIAGEGGLFTALKDHGLKGYQAHAADIAKDAKPSDSVTEAYNMAKAGDPGALVDWLQYALGYGGGQALQMLATAGVGYAGGKLALQPTARLAAEKMIAKESARLAATGMTGEQLAKQAVSNVAGKIGQIGAIGATAVGMEGGEIYGGLVEKAAEEGRSLTGEELAKATGATLGAGILEFVGDKIGLDLILGKSVAGKLVQSRLGHAAAAGSLGVATEGGTEFTQTLIEEFGKGNDPLSPESIKQAVDAAALGGVGGAAVGTAGGLARQPDARAVGTAPTVTERQPYDLGLTPPPDILPARDPLQIEGPPQPGEVRSGKVYGGGPVLDISPLPDVSPVTKASSLDEAIANAVGVVQGATETAKARAAEMARITAKAKNETDALIEAAPQKRAGSEIPILPGPAQPDATLLNQPSTIVSGQAFTPRPAPETDPRARLAEERARMVALREQRRLEQPVNPQSEVVTSAPAVEDRPLPSSADLAYPSSKEVRDLIHEKGFHLDTPVFRQYLKMAVGKETFSDLTPIELQRLHDRLTRIQSAQPKPIEAPTPSVPLTPRKEQPYAPVTTIPEAQVPRSELTPEKNAEILLRAEKAKADMEIAGTERGGRYQMEQAGTGGTNEIVGLKSATADWYKELTSGPSPAIRGDRKQSAREKIEQAIQKIITDQGADRGKAVEQVKAALLNDQEFHQTEWGRDLNSIMQGDWPSWIEKPAGVPRETTQQAQEVSRVDQSAHVAATSPKNELPEPTAGQKEAGNYQKGHTRISGLDISIENPAGSERSGVNAAGKPWSATMKDHYGYIRGTKGKDKEHIDVFVRPGTPEGYSGPVFVVDQNNPGTGAFDEHKAILGASSEADAIALYKQNYGSDWQGFRSIRQFTMPEFKTWLKAGNKQKPAGKEAEQSQREPAAQKSEAAPSVSDKLTVVDQMYRKILDDTKVVHRLQREQKEQWATVKRVDALMKEGVRAGKDYDEAAKDIPAEDIAALSAILRGERTEQQTPQSTREKKETPAKEKPTEAFSLTSPEVSRAKPKNAGPEQLGIDIPPETIGSRPIIGREAQPEEAPLFSKAAQEKDAEQTALSEPLEKTDDAPVIPKQDAGSSAQSKPVDYESIPEGTMVSVMAIRQSTGDEVTVQEDARTALKRIDESLAKYRQLLECVSA